MDTNFLFETNDYSVSDTGKVYLDSFLDVYAPAVLMIIPFMMKMVTRIWQLPGVLCLSLC